MISTTYTAPAQTRAELALHDDTELPLDFDRLKYPILARHVFGLAPGRPALRLVCSQPQGSTDDPVIVQLPPTFLRRGPGTFEHVGVIAERVLARIEVIDGEGSEAA